MDFKTFRENQLKNPEVREAYEELQPNYALAHALIDARISSDLTQKELSVRTGIAQSDISKYENGNGNPSLRTLQRIAKALGKRVRLAFEDAIPVTSTQSDHVPAFNVKESSVLPFHATTQHGKIISIATRPDYHFYAESSYTDLMEE